jgi:GntR family transcriptional regulator
MTSVSNDITVNAMNTRKLKPSTPRLLRSGTSLHRQVYLVLRDRLLAGALQAGERLPAEPALCSEFGVSRITLRRAVGDLEGEGLLERVQGKGTFVTAHGRGRAVRTAGYVDDIKDLSADTTVTVLEFSVVQAPARVAAMLGLTSGERVQRSVRLRQRHNRPVVLLTTWLPAPFAQSITRADLARRPLNEMLAQAGVRFGRVLQEIGAGLADPVQAQRLDVEVGAPLLLVDRLVHNQHGQPVEYVIMAMCPMRSRMVIDTPADLVDQVSSGRIVHQEG